MKTTEIINKLSTKRNGQYFKIQWATEATLSSKGKAGNHKVLKFTTATVRKGISYKNQKAVKEKLNQKMLNGELTPEQVLNYKPTLPWGQWKAGYEGLLLEHKGNDYLRLYFTPNKNKVFWFVDGIPMTKEQVKETGFVIPSYFDKKDPSDCISIKTDSVLAIY